MSNVTKRRPRGNVTPRAEEKELSPNAKKQKIFRDRNKALMAAYSKLYEQVKEKEPKKFKTVLAEIDQNRRDRSRSYWGRYY